MGKWRDVHCEYFFLENSRGELMRAAQYSLQKRM